MNVIKPIAAALVALLVTYLAAVFVAWEANPALWHQAGRFVCVFVGLWLAATAALFASGRL